MPLDNIIKRAAAYKPKSGLLNLKITYTYSLLIHCLQIRTTNYCIGFMPNNSHDTFCPNYHYSYSGSNLFDCNIGSGKLTSSSKKDGGIKFKMDCVFIHGLGQSPSNWNKTVSFLPQHIKSYCPDLMGLCKDNPITYEKIYHAFEEYAGKFEKPINICGLSLGAVLALDYAINKPYKVCSLVLIAPQYKMPRLLLSIQNIVFCVLPQKSFQEIGLQKKDMISLTNSMKTLNFTPMLKDIACPSFIICGQKDNPNKKAAKAMAENISGAQLSFIEKAGHEVNVDTPLKLAELLKWFWLYE